MLRFYVEYISADIRFDIQGPILIQYKGHLSEGYGFLVRKIRRPQDQLMVKISLQAGCHIYVAVLWRQNGRDCVSNHQPHDCLLNRLFRHRLMKSSKLRITGLCAGNSPVIGEFPAQTANNAGNVSISWRHHDHASWINAKLSRVTNEN